MEGKPCNGRNVIEELYGLDGCVMAIMGNLGQTGGDGIC